MGPFLAIPTPKFGYSILGIAAEDPILSVSRLILSEVWMALVRMTNPPWGLPTQVYIRIKMMMMPPGPQYVPIMAQGTQAKRDS